MHLRMIICDFRVLLRNIIQCIEGQMHRFVIFPDHSCQDFQFRKGAKLYIAAENLPSVQRQDRPIFFIPFIRHIPCKKFICTCFAKTDIFIHRAKTLLRFSFSHPTWKHQPFYLIFPAKFLCLFCIIWCDPGAHENLRILSKQRIVTPHHIQMARIQIGLPFTSSYRSRSEAAACPGPRYTLPAYNVQYCEVFVW